MAVHLIEGNFDKNFPVATDEFPIAVDDVNFIDAWLFNTAFNSLTEIEEYLITFKANIEAPLGDDVLGNDGALAVSIPAARYPAGKITLARDSKLLAENIKSGINIFGVAGTLAATGGGITVSLLTTQVVPFLVPPALNISNSAPAVHVPTIHVV